MPNRTITLRTTDGGEPWTLQPVGPTRHLYGVFFTDGVTGTAVGFGGAILRTETGGARAHLQEALLAWLKGTVARLEFEPAVGDADGSSPP